MSLRVSELQVLLGYAGRNKHGRKHELLTKALHLLKAGCSPAVQMKIKELYRRRFPTKMVSPVDLTLPGVHSASSLPAGLAQLGFDSHGSPSPLLPVSLLGPKHELSLPHLPSSLHPVHPDVKLQRLPFYDVLDELIKPTSLGESSTSRTALCVVIMHILMEHCDRRYPNHDLSLRVQYESTLMLGEFCGFPFDHRLRFLFFFFSRSLRQQSTVPGSMLCLCINTTASSTDQQLHVREKTPRCTQSSCVKERNNTVKEFCNYQTTLTSPCVKLF